MDPTMLRDVDQRAEAGDAGTVGVLPDLDPFTAHWAETWTALRSSTPGDQPISLTTLVAAIDLGIIAGNDLQLALFVIQTMDRAFFASERERREEQRKQAERQRQNRARRGRRG